MKLTVQQRREINRENAGKSTGPKTVEGKERSRRNAVTHGLCATALAMPQENPDEVAARTTSWNDHYQPQSPGAQHLVNACVRSTLLSDRVARYHDSAVTEQVRRADDTWLLARHAQFQQLKTLFRVDAERAIPLLAQIVLGVDFLMGRWKVLIDAFVARGYWVEEERAELLRLCGFKADANGLKSNPEAFQLCYFNAILQMKDPADAVRAYVENDQLLPDSLRETFRPDSLPNPRTCVEWLYRLAGRKQEALHARGRALQENVEAAGRVEALDGALILQDEKAARLFLRYSSEARNGFHKAYATLLKTLEADKKEGEEEFRNEADSDRKPLKNHEIDRNEGNRGAPGEGSLDEDEEFENDGDETDERKDIPSSPEFVRIYQKC